MESCHVSIRGALERRLEAAYLLKHNFPSGRVEVGCRYKKKGLFEQEQEGHWPMPFGDQVTVLSSKLYAPGFARSGFD